MNKKNLMFILLLSSFFRLHGCGAKLFLNYFECDDRHFITVETDCKIEESSSDRASRNVPNGEILLIVLEDSDSESCTLTVCDETGVAIVSVDFELRREVGIGGAERSIVLCRIDDGTLEKIVFLPEECAFVSNGEHSLLALYMRLAFDNGEIIIKDMEQGYCFDDGHPHIYRMKIS